MTSFSLKKTSLLLVPIVGISVAGCPTDFGTGIEQAKEALSALNFSEFNGTANLHPVNESGVNARIEFFEDGETLTVTGAASGLDPAESYVTLIYDNGSQPDGPTPCQPTIFDPTDPGFLLPTMFVGAWSVDDNGRGTLVAINTNFGADYVPLERFRSTSVRLVTGPPPPGGTIPMTQLVACGREIDRLEEKD